MRFFPRRFPVRHRQRRDRHEQVLVGIYSTGPPSGPRQQCRARTGGRRPAARPGEQADGPAIVETYTVRYDWLVRTGIVVGSRPGGSAISEDPGAGIASEIPWRTANGQGKPRHCADDSAFVRLSSTIRP